MILPRYYLDSIMLPQGTPGTWYDTDHKTIIAKTLELPWRGNAMSSDPAKASCVPAGILLFRREPPKPGRPYIYFRAIHVIGRNFEPAYGASNILIHRANKVEQLLGCIAPGSRHVDLDKDGGVDIVESTKKMDWMAANLPAWFELEIIRK
jgi:hypothetical protein